jgi:hypothetical protein
MSICVRLQEEDVMIEGGRGWKKETRKPYMQ